MKIDEGTTYCRTNRVLEGIRSHSRQILPRRGVLLTGSRQFGSKQVLFILPIWVAGGGGNLVILAAQAMRRMGVDAQIYNLRAHRAPSKNFIQT